MKRYGDEENDPSRPDERPEIRASAEDGRNALRPDASDADGEEGTRAARTSESGTDANGRRVPGETEAADGFGTDEEDEVNRWGMNSQNPSAVR